MLFLDQRQYLIPAVYIVVDVALQNIPQLVIHRNWYRDYQLWQVTWV